MPSIEIGGLISGRLVYIQSEEAVSKAARLMRDENVASLLVKEKGNFVGIVTEKDLINKVVAEELYPGDIKVKEIMSSPLITISHRESIEKAAKLMRKKEVRRLAVTEGDKMIGVITETDFTRKLISLL
ncbi:hypoxic response protein 1 [archaeon BMS3Abin16]|nr:hypoxic response protein 1 [archaeon BMS3Abin16]HDY74802.1 CBS domain-containing protein [Euryarchaeota archaeon]